LHINFSFLHLCYTLFVFFIYLKFSIVLFSFLCYTWLMWSSSFCFSFPPCMIFVIYLSFFSCCCLLSGCGMIFFFFNFDNDVAIIKRAMQLRDDMCLIKTLPLMNFWQFQILKYHLQDFLTMLWVIFIWPFVILYVYGVMFSLILYVLVLTIFMLCGLGAGFPLSWVGVVRCRCSDHRSPLLLFVCLLVLLQFCCFCYGPDFVLAETMS